MIRIVRNLFVVFFAMLLIAGLSIAQQETEKKEVEVKKEVTHHMMEKMPMMPMMMDRADFKITKDAIFILRGNYLLKYDLDLNLIKKVELPKMEMKMEMMMQMKHHMKEEQPCPHIEKKKEEKKP